MEETYTFRIRRIFHEACVNKGLNISPGRIMGREFVDDLGRQIIQTMLAVATQEEEIVSFPDNWLTRLGKTWHNVKRRLPRWARAILRPGEVSVMAVHKFPEVNVPNNLLGNEFVHFKIWKVLDAKK